MVTGRNTRARGTASALVAFAFAAVASAAPAPAATSSSVVGATVPSATTLDMAGCPNSTGVTQFGVVLPGSSVRTTTDCTISFGSSNDTARLRAVQADATGTAMNRVTWTTGSGGVPSMRRVDMVDANIGYAVGGSGNVIKTTDGGATWSSVSITGDTDPLYQGVHAIDANVVWVSGNGGNVWRTVDGGSNWTQFAIGETTAALEQIVVNGDRIAAAGSGDTFLFSTDAGATWTVVGTGGGNLSAVALLDGGTMLSGGLNWGVRRSTNDGASWSTVFDPGGQIESIRVAADGTIWAAGANGIVGQSSDDGVTWTNVSLPTTDHVEGIFAFDDRTAFVGTRSSVGAWTTVDGGATWTSVDTTASQDIMDVGGVSFDRLITVGFGSQIRRLAQDQPITDFAASTADWSAGSSMFGACLASVGSGAFTDGTTWSVDAAGTAGDCAAVNTDPWNAISSTPSAVARVPSTTTAGTASLRFGMRTSASQPAGDYVAHITFEVVAPA